jgi:hypothetical protein
MLLFDGWHPTKIGGARDMRADHAARRAKDEGARSEAVLPVVLPAQHAAVGALGGVEPIEPLHRIASQASTVLAAPERSKQRGEVFRIATTPRASKACKGLRVREEWQAFLCRDAMCPGRPTLAAHLNLLVPAPQGVPLEAFLSQCVHRHIGTT